MWVGLLCLLTQAGCLYMMAARAALNVASGVAGAGRETPAQTSSTTAVTQNNNALLNAYIHCLRERNQNPEVDCSQHRLALQGQTPE